MIDRLKCFKVLTTAFRHDKDRHGLCFFAVANMDRKKPFSTFWYSMNKEKFYTVHNLMKLLQEMCMAMNL